MTDPIATDTKLSRFHPHVIRNQRLTTLECIFEVPQAVVAAVHKSSGEGHVSSLQSPADRVFLVFEKSSKDLGGDVRIISPGRVIEKRLT